MCSTHIHLQALDTLLHDVLGPWNRTATEADDEVEVDVPEDYSFPDSAAKLRTWLEEKLDGIHLVLTCLHMCTFSPYSIATCGHQTIPILTVNICQQNMTY